MTGIRKSFGSAPVLADVNFRIGAGEIVALLGANGAGKSTLMKILTGIYARDSGSVALDGQPVEIATPRQAAQAGISFLPQEISVLPDMTVAENICIGILPAIGRGSFTNRPAMQAKAVAILAELGFARIGPDAPVSTLSVAEQRVVEIARALAGNARILVMDEPTAALSEQDSQLIFTVLRQLRAKGTSVVYISHYLREVFQIADRIEVLRDGRNAGSFVTGGTSVEEVLAAMLGRASGQLFGGHADARADLPVVFTVEDLNWKGRLHDISLLLRQGEVLGIFGLVGSGIEHLGRVIFGAEGAGVQGRMMVGGRAYRPSTPAHAKAAGLGFVTAERKKDGILGEMSVAENLASAYWRDYRAGPLTSAIREAEHAQTWIGKLGIRTSGPDQVMRLLSGGNQQKVCVARWLHPSVKILILEEPKRGVDVGARRDIYTHLANFAAEGLAILVLSSDAEEVAGLSDRAMVMNRGRIVKAFEAGADAAMLMAATATGDVEQVGSR
jgi:ribose transport system ATP-binding protein